MRRVDLVDMDADEGTGSDAATVSLRPDEPRAGADLAGAEDKTVAMPIVAKPVGPEGDDAKTMALPIQQRVDRDATQRMRTDAQPGADRVPPGAGRTPLSKPPSTPRPAPGPKQAGAQQAGVQGPTAPAQGAEETKPSPPGRPAAPRQVASAPSPADVQATRPAQSVSGPRPPQPRPIAQPQRIAPPSQTPPTPDSADAPRGRSRRWLFAVLAAAAVVVIVIIGVTVALVANNDSNTPDAKVRASITDYTQALKSGDLVALRKTTCGPLHDFYQGIPEDQFAGVHKLSADRKSIPVVASVDAVRITDNKAIAQATVYTDADPTKRSSRTFDLESTNDGWKVCDPPTTAP